MLKPNDFSRPAAPGERQGNFLVAPGAPRRRKSEVPQIFVDYSFLVLAALGASGPPGSRFRAPKRLPGMV